MAVNLSPVGGVAAQFFDNSGNVLTGGLLYSYLAGTTTPAITYTSSSGLVANSNPIVLDAAGRVPSSGEIWLTDGISYKFILQDQNAVQIASWDNIVGINSNFIAYTGQTETQTATQGQTLFTLTSIQYQPGVNNLSVFVNGSKQVSGTNFQETSSTTVTFVDGLNVGDIVEFSTAEAISTTVTSANDVSYIEGGTGSVYRSVTSKLQEQISILDFGAVADGDGYGGGTDNSAAIQAAIDYIVGNVGYGVKNKLWIPAGIYCCDTGLTLDLSVCGIESNGATLDFTNLVPAAGGAYAAGVAAGWIGAIQGVALTVTAGGDGYAGGAYYEFTNSVRGLRIKGKEGASEGGTPPSAPNDTIGVYFYGPVGETAVNGMFESCVITQFYTGVIFGQNEFGVMFQQCQIGFTSSCVVMPLANNAGEKNVFSSCILFNSENGFVLENSNADTFIENTSIDGMSDIFLYVTCGEVSLNGCHFEGDMSAANLIWNDGSAIGSYATITMNGCVIVSKTGRNTPLFIFSGLTSCSIHGGLVEDSNGSTVTLFGGNNLSTSVTIVGGYWASNASLFGFSVPANAYTTVVGLLGLGINGNLTTNQVITTSKNIQGSTIFANSGIFDNNVTTLYTTTLNVAVPFAIPNSAIGLLIIRDATVGGQALYMCEVFSAVVAVQTSVSGITVNYSGGGDLQLTVTSGTAARSIRWAFIRTN